MVTKTAPTKLAPAHPGAILREEFIEGLGVTPYAVAKAIKVPLPRVNDIVLEKRNISPEMGLLLSDYFGTSDSYWINLQADYDKRMAQSKIADSIKAVTPYKAVAA